MYPLIILFLLPLVAFGQESLPDTLPDPLTSRTIPELARFIAEQITPIAIAFIILVFIYAGVLFATAGGSEEKINKAKSALTWAFIGAFFIIGAWVLAEGFIESIEDF